MKIALHTLITLFASICLLSATEPQGSIDFSGASTQQVLDIYAHFSGCKLVVDSRVRQVRKAIYLRAPAVSKNEMKELVKKALLQQAGIVLTPLDDNRVSVTYNDALPVTQHNK